MVAASVGCPDCPFSGGGGVAGVDGPLDPSSDVVAALASSLLELGFEALPLPDLDAVGPIEGAYVEQWRIPSIEIARIFGPAEPKPVAPVSSVTESALVAAFDSMRAELETERAERRRELQASSEERERIARERADVERRAARAEAELDVIRSELERLQSEQRPESILGSMRRRIFGS